MLDNEDLRRAVDEIILNLRREMHPVCVARWKAWRSDFESELRRRRFEKDPSSWKKLRLHRLEDPFHFFKSIENTHKEVFHDFNSAAMSANAEILNLRNMVAHNEDFRDNDVLRAAENSERLKKSLGLLDPNQAAVSTSWPPKSIPPPPVGLIPNQQIPVIPPREIDAEIDIEILEDGKQQLLTCYVVCDRSDSMIGEGISSVNESLFQLHKAIASDPVIADKCRLSVLSFSTKPQLELPLTNLLDVSSMPKIEADGITNYGLIFSELRMRIESDLTALSLTHRPLRPIVFFLTDGAPSDQSWEQALADLVDAGQIYVPSVIVMPVAPIPEHVINSIRGVSSTSAPRVQSYQLGQKVDEAVRRAIESVTRSIIASAASDDGDLVLSGLELQDA